MNNKGKEANLKIVFFIMLIAFAIAGMWDSLPTIKNFIHSILDPTAGAILNWNYTYGMMALVLMITFIATLIQKYTTDQETLREMKKEQKILQGEMKKYRDQPEKMIELNKKSLEFIPKTFKLTMRGMAFTLIPFILFFKWFQDFFTLAGNPRFFGIMGWFIFYLLFSIIFSSILRKMLKVV